MAEGSRLRFSIAELDTKAAAYMQAARDWASRARDLALVVAGDDSPLFAVYDLALGRCWRGAVEAQGGGEGGVLDAEATASITFSEMWSDIVLAGSK